MKTGDRVVCVKSHLEAGLVKGKTYIILSISTLECGCICVDVGLSLPAQTRSFCFKHDLWGPRDGILWLYLNRFAPIETKRDFISSEDFKTIEETIDVPIPENA